MKIIWLLRGSGNPGCSSGMTVGDQVEHTVNGQTTSATYLIGGWQRATRTDPDGNVTRYTWSGSDLLAETTTFIGGGSTSAGYLSWQGMPLWRASGGSVVVYGRDLLGDLTGIIVPAAGPNSPYWVRPYTRGDMDSTPSVWGPSVIARSTRAGW